MIRIITESFDHTINRLIDRLIYYDLSFERINTDQFIRIATHLNKIDQEAKIIYNRRGSYKLYPNYSYNAEVLRYLKREVLEINYFIEKQESETAIRIGSLFSEYNNNKLYNLNLAKKTGFKVPDTLVTNYKDELIAFYKKHKKSGIITKDLKYPTSWIEGPQLYKPKGTFKVSNEHIASLHEVFSPMFFQKFIRSVCEIRTFFFLDSLFSIGIVTNGKESIDIRNTYEHNRFIPFKLPLYIESALMELARKLKMNTFSCDIILDEKGNYFFLELNPMGQYDFVDSYGFYDIPDKMALRFKSLLAQ